MTIDWGTSTINVFKTDMLLVQAAPTVIYELDIPNFKSALGNMLDDEHGMVYPNIFNHNPEVSVGGVTLAKVIEILAPYTITFEDGQYAVNLVNANSNVGDRVNVNQVSVRSANSAGLTNVREIQAASYQGIVALDAINGVAGTTFPIGTHATAVNNLVDATFIADLRGLEVMVVHGAFNVLAGDDLRGRTYRGENTITTSMIIDAGANVANTQLEDMFIYNSTMSASTYMKHVSIANTTGISGYIESSMLAQNIGLSNRAHSYFIDCKSACVGLGTTDLPILDMTGTGMHVAFRNWSGPIKFNNSTDAANTMCVDVTSGTTITLDATCTAGTISIRGIADVVNNSAMTVIMVDALSPTSITDISSGVWNNANASTTAELKKLANLVLATS